MNDKIMDKINIILYYVVAPVLVLEFLLTDLGIIAFTIPLFAGSALVLLALIAVSFFIKGSIRNMILKLMIFIRKYWLLLY